MGELLFHLGVSSRLLQFLDGMIRHTCKYLDNCITVSGVAALDHSYYMNS